MATYATARYPGLQEGNADSLQIERQSEEELRADFIAKSLG